MHRCRFRYHLFLGADGKIVEPEEVGGAGARGGDESYLGELLGRALREQAVIQHGAIRSVGRVTTSKYTIVHIQGVNQVVAVIV